MSKWWTVRIQVSDIRAALRDIASDEGEHAADALGALAHLRGRRGSLNFVEATSGLGGDVGAKAVLAEVGAAILNNT